MNRTFDAWVDTDQEPTHINGLTVVPVRTSFALTPGWVKCAQKEAAMWGAIITVRMIDDFTLGVVYDETTSLDSSTGTTARYLRGYLHVLNTSPGSCAPNSPYDNKGTRNPQTARFGYINL